MIDIRKAMKDKRMIKALIGIRTYNFKLLTIHFEEVLKEDKYKNSKNRKRQPGGGKKHTLANAEMLLFFILFYCKTYPTFDLAAAIFNVNRSQTNRWFHKLLPLLEKALGKEITLPARKLETMEQLFSLYPEIKDVFINSTERRIRRPQDKEKQQDYYSGKKKTNTVKNTVITTKYKEILFLGETCRDSKHDKKDYDDNQLGDMDPNITQWVDTGYQGIAKLRDNFKIPTKKPKGGELTQEEKRRNQEISSIRVVNEQAIGGIKRLRCVSDIYRNVGLGVLDQLMVVAAAIWNLELRKTA